MNALGKYLLVVGLVAMGFAMGCEKKEEAPSADAPAEEIKEGAEEAAEEVKEAAEEVKEAAEEVKEEAAEAGAAEAPAEGDAPEAPPASQ